MKKFPFIYSFLILLLLGSCIKDNFDTERLSDRISYRPSFVIPLAKGSLTLGNLLEPDDSLIFFDADNSIRLVIREDSIFSVSFEDVLKIPLPESASRQFPVTPVPLDPFNSTSVINLEDLVEPGRIGDPEASTIHGSAGSTIHFPSVPEQSIGSFPADPLVDIDFARFTQGEVEMTVTNNLPVGVSMDIILFNDPEGEQVGIFTFENLGPGQTDSRSASLSGITVRQNMSLEIVRFSSPGSGGEQVFIDLADDLEIEISSNGLLAETGNAKLPLFDIDAGSDLLRMDFPANQRIDELNLESGTVHYGVDNNVGGIMLKVEMANVTSSGDSYEFNLSPDGTGGMYAGEESLSDVEIDLAAHDSRLMVNYSLVIGSDEGMTYFDFTPGMLSLNLDFSGFTTGYASGYFGYEEFDLEDEDMNIEIDIFENITGDFRLTNPSVRIFYENSLGVPFHLEFNLEGESSGGENKVTLLEPDHPGFNIEYPTEPFNIASGDILIDRETSEIVEFIALPPAKIQFDAITSQNPLGDTGTLNFITSQSHMHVGLEIELPLEMQLTNLGLTDTIEIDMDPEDIDIIEMLILNLEVTNRFPLGISLDLSLYDSVQNVVLHAFDNIVLLDAVPVDENGIAVSGNETDSSASIEISGSTIDHLRQATHIILSGSMNTGRHGNEQVPVKFLTTSGLDFKIRLKADLNIEN